LADAENDKLGGAEPGDADEADKPAAINVVLGH